MLNAHTGVGAIVFSALDFSRAGRLSTLNEAFSEGSEHKILPKLQHTVSINTWYDFSTLAFVERTTLDFVSTRALNLNAPQGSRRSCPLLPNMELLRVLIMGIGALPTALPSLPRQGLSAFFPRRLAPSLNFTRYWYQYVTLAVMLPRVGKRRGHAYSAGSFSIVHIPGTYKSVPGSDLKAFKPRTDQIDNVQIMYRLFSIQDLRLSRQIYYRSCML